MCLAVRRIDLNVVVAGGRPDATQSDRVASRESKPSWKFGGASNMRGIQGLTGSANCCVPATSESGDVRPYRRGNKADRADAKA